MSNCITGKVDYPNRKEAVAAMNKYNKFHDKKAKSVYRCPYCKCHHFTTQNRADSKQDRKYHIVQAFILKQLHQIYTPPNFK